MPRVYEQDGVRFMYPDNWAVEEMRAAGEVSLHIQGPHTGFVLLVIYDGQRDCGQLVAQVVDAMKEEYPELDTQDVDEPVGEHPACGCDLNFFSFDLTNTAWVRAFRTTQRSLLVMGQCNDLDLGPAEMVFRAVCASLTVDEAPA
jgi:hypothetical protein